MIKKYIVKIYFTKETDFCESDLQEAIIEGIENIGNYAPQKIIIK